MMYGNEQSFKIRNVRISVKPIAEINGIYNYPRKQALFAFVLKSRAYKLRTFGKQF